IVAHLKANLPPALEYIAARNRLPYTAHFLIYRWFVHANFAAHRAQHQVPVAVDADLPNTRKGHFDSSGVAAGSDLKVIFELSLITIVNQIYSGIEVAVLNPREIRYVRLPL